MIDLKDAQTVSERRAISQRIEARAEHHGWPAPSLTATVKSIFGNARARGNEPAYPRPGGVGFRMA